MNKAVKIGAFVVILLIAISFLWLGPLVNEKFEYVDSQIELNEAGKRAGFSESLNIAVLTTKFVIEKKPITYVSHDLDGTWQFHTDDQFENYQEVARVLSLGEVIQIDSTIIEVCDLPMGFKLSDEVLALNGRLKRLTSLTKQT